MGPACNDVPLISLNSISKGFFGECGRRGGYMELVNFPEDVKAELYKLASISLCPNIKYVGEGKGEGGPRGDRGGEGQMSSYARFMVNGPLHFSCLQQKQNIHG
jgi:hypothetical protein